MMSEDEFNNRDKSIVPKPYHKDLQKFKNPLRVIVEEMETGMMSEEEFNNRDKSKDQIRWVRTLRSGLGLGRMSSSGK